MAKINSGDKEDTDALTEHKDQEESEQEQEESIKAEKEAQHKKDSVKLTGGGRKKIGSLTTLKDMPAADAIRTRGGGASQVNQLQTGYEQKTVDELANLAASGDEAAETAIKIIKQASKKAAKHRGKS